MDGFLQFLTRVAIVKRTIYQNLADENSANFCQCRKLYFIRKRIVYEPICIVGLCVTGWGKIKQLLHRANHVFVMNIFCAKAKIWLVEDHERVDEYKRVQGLREDADKYITKFCLLAQDICYKNQDLFGDERLQFDKELLLDDSLDLHISCGVPLHEGLGTSSCLPLDYFQSIYDIWLRDQYFAHPLLITEEE